MSRVFLTLRSYRDPAANCRPGRVGICHNARRMRGQPPTSPALPSAQAGIGLAAAICAFTIWGVLPLYLKPLSHLPALEIMAHRIVWCCVLVFGWLALRGEVGLVREALANQSKRYRLERTAELISIN